MSSNVVYHYCSLDTFNLIISNKTLRVSDISKSNDSEELKWISNKISSTVINCIIRDKILCQKYNIDDEKINIIKSRLKRTTDSVFVNNSRNMLSLACCFSEVGDLLSQWRGYANDGNGVSIGFNKEILMRLNSYSFSYKFYKVEYNNQNQINFIERYIDDVIKSYVQVDSEEITDATFSEFLQDLISRTAALFNEAPAFKNK